MGQVFFTNFGMPNQPREQKAPWQLNYDYNVMVLEISSNWFSVKKLMSEIYNEKRKTVTQLENEWANFLISNNINVLEYANSDNFIDSCFKARL